MVTCTSIFGYMYYHSLQWLFCNLSRLLRVVYGPPEESDARQAQVTTLVNNLRNTGGDLEIGPCGEYQQLYSNLAGSLLMAYLFCNVVFMIFFISLCIMFFS